MAPDSPHVSVNDFIQILQYFFLHVKLLKLKKKKKNYIVPLRISSVCNKSRPLVNLRGDVKETKRVIFQKNKRHREQFNTDFISKFTFTARSINVNQLIKHITIKTITTVKLE